MTLLIAPGGVKKQHDPLYRLTVDQYHEMLRGGILSEGEPFELLDGIIVHKNRSAAGENTMSVGNHHTWVVQKLIGLNPRLRRLGCHLRAQQPLLVKPHSEPEPDGAIVVGTEDDYLDRKPQPKDTFCVIEVADATVQYDRTEKLEIYANCGIACYMIANIPARVMEVYSGPQKGKGRYRNTQIIAREESIEFPVGNEKQALRVLVKRLIP